MKIYNVTFNDNAANELSTVTAATSANSAKNQVRILMSYLYEKRFHNYKANVVIHGADGAGKSLNKLKKK